MRDDRRLETTRRYDVVYKITVVAKTFCLVGPYYWNTKISVTFTLYLGLVIFMNIQERAFTNCFDYFNWRTWVLGDFCNLLSIFQALYRTYDQKLIKCIVSTIEWLPRQKSEMQSKMCTKSGTTAKKNPKTNIKRFYGFKFWNVLQNQQNEEVCLYFTLKD